MNADTYFASFSNRPLADLRKRVVGALGGACKECGITDPRVLQIDHVDGGGTAERGKNNRNWPQIYQRIADGWTSGYQLLCANCNQIKRWEQREFGKRLPSASFVEPNLRLWE